MKHQITSLSQPFAVTFSRDGKRAYVSDDGTNQLIAFDVATRAELGRVLVGRRPSYIGMSTDDRRVFVANTNDHTVSVVDALTMSVSGTIAVGSIPYGLTVVPQSGEVFVALAGEGAIAVLDKTGTQVISRIAVGNNPQTLALLGSGRRAYVTVQSPGTVIEIDTQSHAVLRQLFVVDNAGFIAASADGRSLYIAEASPGGRVRTVDLASWRVVADLGTGHYPGSLARAANGPRLFVPGTESGELWVVDTVSNTIVHTLDLGGRTFAAAVTPLATELMVPADVTVASGTTPSYTVQLDSNGMAVGGQYFETAIAGSVTVASGVTESMPVVVPLDVSLSLGRHQFVTSYFGNQHYSAASAVTTFTVVDGTGPEVAATVEGTQHSSGWFTSDVKITWTVSTTIRHRVINRLWPGHGYRGIGGRDHADVHRDERGRHDHEVDHHSKGCHATGNHLAARWRDLRTWRGGERRLDL